MNEKLSISQFEPFARGGNRACYVDPRNADRCVKVSLPGKTAVEKRNQAPFLKRFRPAGYFDDNLREWRTYLNLEKLRANYLWSHLPRCHGLVDTDLGPGIVTDLIRNADGTVSSDLKSKLRERGRDLHFQQAVNDFISYLRETRLPTRDLLLHNLVAQNMSSSNNFKIYVIDGFGSSDVLPLVYWSKRMASAKVERKVEKFRLKIDEFCDKYKIPEQ